MAAAKAPAKKTIIKNLARDTAAQLGMIAVRHDEIQSISHGGKSMTVNEFGVIFIPRELVETFAAHGFVEVPEGE